MVQPVNRRTLYSVSVAAHAVNLSQPHNCGSMPALAPELISENTRYRLEQATADWINNFGLTPEGQDNQVAWLLMQTLYAADNGLLMPDLTFSGTPGFNQNYNYIHYLHDHHGEPRIVRVNMFANDQSQLDIHTISMEYPLTHHQFIVHPHQHYSEPQEMDWFYSGFPAHSKRVYCQSASQQELNEELYHPITLNKRSLAQVAVALNKKNRGASKARIEEALMQAPGIKPAFNRCDDIQLINELINPETYQLRSVIQVIAALNDQGLSASHERINHFLRSIGKDTAKKATADFSQISAECIDYETGKIKTFAQIAEALRARGLTVDSRLTREVMHLMGGKVILPSASDKQIQDLLFYPGTQKTRSYAEIHAMLNHQGTGTSNNRISSERRKQTISHSSASNKYSRKRADVFWPSVLSPFMMLSEDSLNWLNEAAGRSASRLMSEIFPDIHQYSGTLQNIEDEEQDKLLSQACNALYERQLLLNNSSSQNHNLIGEYGAKCSSIELRDFTLVIKVKANSQNKLDIKAVAIKDIDTNEVKVAYSPEPSPHQFSRPEITLPSKRAKKSASLADIQKQLYHPVMTNKIRTHAQIAFALQQQGMGAATSKISKILSTELAEKRITLPVLSSPSDEQIMAELPIPQSEEGRTMTGIIAALNDKGLRGDPVRINKLLGKTSLISASQQQIEARVIDPDTGNFRNATQLAEALHRDNLKADTVRISTVLQSVTGSDQTKFKSATKEELEQELNQPGTNIRRTYHEIRSALNSKKLAASNNRISKALTDTGKRKTNYLSASADEIKQELKDPLTGKPRSQAKIRESLQKRHLAVSFPRIRQVIDEIKQNKS